MSFKSLLVLDKSKAVVKNNKYVFYLPPGTKINGYRIKEVNIPSLNVDLASMLNNEPKIIYVDSNRIDSYSEDGSKAKPYKLLTTALNAKLTDSETTTFIFKLSAGNYDGTINIDKTAQNQSFSIIGQGKDRTFIRGSSSWDSTTSNVLFFRDFNNITIKNVTIQNGAYGFYPRSCKKIELDNVKFINLGSDGTVNRHDFTGSKVEQAAFWAGTSTNDGGVCRIRSCEEVVIQNCVAEYCLRGFRIQDCGTTGKNSIVCNNKIYRVLESGIYLASGSYTGSAGCENFTVIGNTVQECFNNSLLVIGGKHNTIQSNHLIGGANAGIQLHSALDTKVHHNSIYNCNRLTYNGIGNDGDAWGSIVIAGNTNIGAGDFMGIIHSNSMLKCNQGRESEIVGINIQSSAYPAASNKLVIKNNISDATNRFKNANNITISTVEDTETLDLSPHSVTELNDVSNAGSGVIITGAERTKITTNETNITNINTVISTDSERIAAVTLLTTSYTAADTALNDTITTALTTKANVTDLNTTNTNVTTNATAIALKANQSSLDTTNTNVTTNATAIALKANQSSLDTTNTNVTTNATAISTNATAISGKQDTLTFNAVSSNNANPSTSAQIKTYVDANAGGSIPTLVNLETKSFSSIGSIGNYIFECGTTERGYITINASGTLSGSNWWDCEFRTSLINSTNSNGYFWNDLVLVPSGSSHRVIEQERSFKYVSTGSIIRKRMYLENASVYNGNELCKIFFRLTQ